MTTIAKLNLMTFIFFFLFSNMILAQRSYNVSGAGEDISSEPHNEPNGIYVEDIGEDYPEGQGYAIFKRSGDHSNVYHIRYEPDMFAWVIYSQDHDWLFRSGYSVEDLPPQNGWYKPTEPDSDWELFVNGILPAPTVTEIGSLPVELTVFSARISLEGIVLSWITESETDNLGFILERSEDSSMTWVEISSYLSNYTMQGQGNTSATTTYQFLDFNIQPNQTYVYRLSDVSIEGVKTTHDPLEITYDINQNNIPKSTTLNPAYPNPFNPETKISYHLAKETEVTLTVVDLNGRHVKDLFIGSQLAGSYNIYWNSKDTAGKAAASGIYILILKTVDVIKTQRVTLMR